ncbi:hypothetical protein Q1695_015888 [Nippostrongylus brasiliensis]|nr:hypothetical protein Q1695_015888 [Nippostrongylus brasiliensis]
MLWWPTARTAILVAVMLIVTAVSQEEICFPDTCVDPNMDSLFSYSDCCANTCCYRLRFWVIPACIAGVGFVADSTNIDRKKIPKRHTQSAFIDGHTCLHTSPHRSSRHLNVC